MPKMFNKDYLNENGHIIFRERELIIEKEQKGENTMLRFKIGDGVKPYNALQYISSMYALFPKICLCDTNYDNCLNIKFSEDD